MGYLKTLLDQNPGLWEEEEAVKPLPKREPLGWLDALEARAGAAAQGEFGRAFGPEAELEEPKAGLAESIPVLGSILGPVTQAGRIGMGALGAVKAGLVDKPLEMATGVPGLKAEDILASSRFDLTRPWAADYGQLAGLEEASRRGPQAKEAFQVEQGLPYAAKRAVGRFALDPTLPVSLGRAGVALLPALVEAGVQAPKEWIQSYMQQGLTPELKAAIPETALTSVMAALATGAHVPRKPATRAAVANAKHEAHPIGADEFAPRPPFGLETRPVGAAFYEAQLSPGVRADAEFLAGQSLLAINESAAGGFQGQMPGEVPQLPIRRVVLTGQPGIADVVGDTINLHDGGVKWALSGATDAASFGQRLHRIIAHEVQHPTEAGMGAQRTGAALGPGGHAAGTIADDRTMSLTQQFREWGINEASRQHPLVKQAAALVEKQGNLKDAFLPPTADLSPATFPLRDVALFHDLMGEEAGPRPVVPKHLLKDPEAMAPEYPLLEAEGLTTQKPSPGPLMAGRKFEESPEARAALEQRAKAGEDLIAQAQAKLAEKPSLALRALTNRQPPPAKPGATGLEAFPHAKALVDRLRAKRENLGKLPMADPAVAVDQLLEGFRSGQIKNAADLQRLGIEEGDLWPVANNLSQFIRNKLGGFEKGVPVTPAGKALWAKVEKLRNLAGPRAFMQHPRALGQNPRALGTNLRSLRAAKASQLQAAEGKTGNKLADSINEQAAQFAEGRERVRQQIVEGNKVPRTGTTEEKLKWLDRMMAKAKTAKAAIEAKLPMFKGFQRATLERTAQANRLTRKELWALQEQERLRKKADEGSGKLQAGRKFGENLIAPPKKEKKYISKKTGKNPNISTRMLREEGTAEPKPLAQVIQQLPAQAKSALAARMARGYQKGSDLLKSLSFKTGTTQVDKLLSKLRPEQVRQLRGDPAAIRELVESALKKPAVIGETGQRPATKVHGGRYRAELRKKRQQTAQEPRNLGKFRPEGAYKEKAAEARERLLKAREKQALESFKAERIAEPPPKPEPYTGRKLEEVPPRWQPPKRQSTAAERAGKPVKKAEPTVYPFKRGLEAKKDILPLERALTTKEPLKVAAAHARGDALAIQKLDQVIRSGGEVRAATVADAGFSPVLRARVQLLLKRAAAPQQGKPRDPASALYRFRQGLLRLESEVLTGEPGARRLPKGFKPEREARHAALEKVAKVGKKESLEGELAKRLPEGKLHPIKRPAGAALPRKEATQAVGVWADEAGQVAEEVLRGAKQVQAELSAELGIRVPEELLAPAATPKRSPIQLMSKILTAKNFLPKVISQLEAAVEKIKAKGASPAKAEALLQKLKQHESQVNATFRKGKLMDINWDLVPASTAAGKPKLESIPDSLNPFISKKERTGGKAGKRHTLGLEEKAAEGKASVRTQAEAIGSGAKTLGEAALGDQPYSGPIKGIASEPIIAAPRPARGAKARVQPDAQARAKFIQERVKEGMERATNTIDELGATGRLRNYEAFKKLEKVGYEYKNVLDYMDDIDFNDEYYLNKAELGRYEQKLRRQAGEEYDTLQLEAAEERGDVIAQAKKERLEAPPLSRETKAWLDQQTVPRVARTSGGTSLASWVKAQVLGGDIKPSEEGAAISYLNSKRLKGEESIGRRPVSAAERAAYLAKKRKAALASSGGDLEMAGKTLKGESEWVAPWEKPEKLQAGRKFTPAEERALDEEAIKLGKVKVSAATKNRREQMEAVGEWLNVTRPLVTSVDVSNPFRQTFQLTTDQLAQDLLKVVLPIERKAHTVKIKGPSGNETTVTRYSWGRRSPSDTSLRKNVWDMFRSFASEDYANQRFLELKADRWFQRGRVAGLNYISEHSPHEAWVGKAKLDKAIAAVEKKVPPTKAFRSLINASERAFRYYQNKAMRDAYKFGREYLQNMMDVSGEAIPPAKMKSLVEHINNAASRGKVSGNASVDKAVNYLLYSGQMNASRLRMLKDVASFSWKNKTIGFASYGDPQLSHYARMQLIRSIAGAVAFNGTVFALLAASGQKPTIETDARSTDYGKIKAGDVVFDGGGGWYQFLRAGKQIATSSEKERGTGIVKPKAPLDTMKNFLRSKLSPGATLVVDALSRRTVEGEAIDLEKDPATAVGRLAWNLIEPMSIKDVTEIVNENPSAGWLIPLMLMGSGVNSDLPSGTKAWRTGALREVERSNRMELRARGVNPPVLGSKVTIPGRDPYGRPNYYTLSESEREEFNKVYMPLVTQALNDFISTEHYQKLADPQKKKALFRKVHQLNKQYGVATKGRAEYRAKAKRGEIKPSNRKSAEEMLELPGGGSLIVGKEEE